jgi:hypothetical protein
MSQYLCGMLLAQLTFLLIRFPIVEKIGAVVGMFLPHVPLSGLIFLVIQEKEEIICWQLPLARLRVPTRMCFFIR